MSSSNILALRRRHHFSIPSEFSSSALDLQSAGWFSRRITQGYVETIWVNYNELTTSSLEIIVSKGNHPQMAARFRLVNYYNLPRYVETIWELPRSEINLIVVLLCRNTDVRLLLCFFYVCFVVGKPQRLLMPHQTGWLSEGVVQA